MSDETRDTPSCRACGGRDVIPILYGLPGPEAQESAGRGEIALGGCIVEPDNPDWACRSCGERWAIRTRELSAERSSLLGWTKPPPLSPSRGLDQAGFDFGAD